jgi:all-trans-8'-apo-beta-carotenal 15,15'-oxygenase
MRLLLLITALLSLSTAFKLPGLRHLESKCRLRDQRSVSEIPNPIDGSYSFPQWEQAFKTQSAEFDYIVDQREEMIGSIPLDFPSGTLFRAMPSLFERNGVSYGHYLDGDGYIIKFSIDKESNEVTFSSRFVKTEEFQAESESDSIKVRSTFRTQRVPNAWSLKLSNGAFDLANAFDLKLKNLANTNVVFWGEKLFSLFEAGIPYELDPFNLNTIDKMEMGLSGVLTDGLPVYVPDLNASFPSIHASLFSQHMTAHPKIDPIRKTLVAWTWCAGTGLPGIPAKNVLDSRPIVNFREWDEALMPLHDKTLPIASVILKNTSVSPHDFSITPSYYVIIENRLAGDTLPYILGTKCPAECVNVMPSEDMLMHLVPRSSNSGKEKLTIPLKPGFTIHSVASWENIEENTLELLTTAWRCEDVASGQAQGGLLGNWEGTAPNFDSIPLTLLYHSIVDTSSGALIRHDPVIHMEDIVVEHPHINPHYESQKVRYVYMSVGSQTGVSSPPLGYLKLDIQTGKREYWYAPLHTYCEEVVVIPKENGKDEDDVYLMVTMFDSVKDKSCVAILDGKDIGSGPVSTTWLRLHLPHSLHGSFIDRVF